MRSPETFDAYYVETRTRLLHEAFALTGDAPAARAAVRDAFVVAWHHWRKVEGLEDRDAYVRPLAFRRARRRHTARIWHRDKSLDPEARSTLDALSKLSARQRELLVLNALSALSLNDIARSVGLTRSDAERELQTAASQFSLNRDVPTTEVQRLLQDLAQPLAETRWPRASVVRRSGAARRRTHTVIGAAVATTALLVSGSLVASGSGAQPTSLSEEKATSGIDLSDPDTGGVGEAVIDEAALLSSAQVARFGSGLEWDETSTSDNLAGDGLVAPCQRERFSDPDGLAALARTWEGSATEVVRKTVGKGDRKRTRKQRVTRVRATAVQIVERSRNEEQAADSFEAASLWFASCADPRTQLLRTSDVKRVGDEARQFRLRTWGKTPATIAVGTARTGSLVVTTAVRTTGRPLGDAASLRGLAAAVNALCGTDGAATCAGRATARTTSPLDIGALPGLLSVVDLPPVSAVRGPWVGTDPEKAGRTNFASTRCDNTTFTGKGIKLARTRTFLFPETRNVDQLGLTQVVGSMKPRAADTFVDQVRTRVRQCGQANLGTTVTPLTSSSTKDTDLHAWALSMELNDKQSFPFLMAIVRDGTAVSQLGFSPQRNMTMSRDDFVALSRRVLERLATLRARG
jgi:DNA-directed RNA polymerase specialized sigma24 family protein